MNVVLVTGSAGLTAKFRPHYPDWTLGYVVPAILEEIYENNLERWRGSAPEVYA
jgi:hypothetical protein